MERERENVKILSTVTHDLNSENISVLMYVNYENSTVSIDLTTMITKDKHDKYVHTPFLINMITVNIIIYLRYV